MKLIALVMARNAGSLLKVCLERMSEYCDGALVLDDRSTDQTGEIALRHRLVKKVYTVDRSVGEGNWCCSEGHHLTKLYSMAEAENADWVVRLDCDEYIDPGNHLRAVLEGQPKEVFGVRFPKQSTWDDPNYPELVPLMGPAKSRQGSVWRGLVGLRAEQPLHNPRMPEGISARGRVADCEWPIFYHTGWNTLERRLQRARFYLSLDPSSSWNNGVCYDRGLLFGYSLDAVDELVREYRKRFREKQVTLLEKAGADLGRKI